MSETKEKMSETKENKTLTMIKNFYASVNAKDNKTVWNNCLSDKFMFVHPKVPMPLDKKTFIDLMVNDVVPSFPDFNFNVSDKTIKENKDGTYSVTVHITATHTGKAFTFMGLEPIPTSNKKLEFDDEPGTVTVSDGQITSLTIHSTVELSGPMGAYIMLGGKPPNPNISLIHQFHGSVAHKDGRSMWDKFLADDFKFTHTKVPEPQDKKSFTSLMYDNIIPSFPDWNFNLEEKDIKENKDGSCTAVVRITCTHSGKAFSFMGLDAIPTSGKKLTFDPEEGTIKISNGKIKSIQVNATSDLSGPMGAYIMLGGKPPKQEEKKK